MVFSIIHGVSGVLVALACAGWNRLIDGPGASASSSRGTGHRPKCKLSQGLLAGARFAELSVSSG